jgi:ABC-2 type transport system ATP-binding protein
VNGLDPEGILWIRQFMHRLAGEGRTVFVSSHLLSEMSLTAQDLVVIGRGRLIAQTSTSAFIDAASEARVRVRGPELDTLRSVLVAGGLTVSDEPARGEVPAALAVTGATTDEVGRLAGEAGVVLYELSAQRGSLEQAFIQMTGGDVEFQSGRSAVPAGAGSGMTGGDGDPALAALGSQPGSLAGAGPEHVGSSMTKR